MITAKSKTAKIQAIRHEIRPSIGINYKPDFNKRNYYRTQIDTGNIANGIAPGFDESSVFLGNVFSPYGLGKSAGISFSIDNNIQMKVLNKKDTGENALKKVTLIDGLSLDGNYNFLADSFQLSNLFLNLRTNLFEKVNVTASANIDPYDVDKNGNRLKSLLWKRKPISLGRVTTANLSISSQFQGGKNKVAPGKPNPITNNNPQTYGYTDDEYNSELNDIRSNPGDYADFNIPWSVNFSYALRFDKTFRRDLNAFKTSFSQDLNGGGTLGLTKKWQLGLNGSFDITKKEVGYVSASVSRDMHCWQMSINIGRGGYSNFYSINISPKSGLLRDLKVNRTRSSYNIP